MSVCRLYDYNTFKMEQEEILSSFSILHLNVQSLRAKFNKLECFLTEIVNFKVLCFTETWLTNSEDQLYNFPEYKSVSSCRNNKNGGTSIYVKESVKFVVREDIYSLLWEDKVFELTIIEIKEPNFCFLVACVYRPPNSNINKFMKKLETLLDKSSQEKKTDCMRGL